MIFPCPGGRHAACVRLFLASITRSVYLVINCDWDSECAQEEEKERKKVLLRRLGASHGTAARDGRLSGVRVYLGSDHARFGLKAAIIAWLGEAGHEAVDCGPHGYDPQDDYPVYVLRAAEGVIADPGSLGIVIGGSGNGEQIAANKVPGIRAALAWTTGTATLARQHNDANVLSLGAREYSVDDAVSFVKVFVETPFSGETRHARRLAQITEYETTGELPPLP